MGYGDRYGVVDVHYPDGGGARAALLVAADLRFATVVAGHTAWLDRVQPYRPGGFYARELPPLRAVLALGGALRLLLVDGYVDLDPAGRPGLGAYVHQETGLPVIGVAKTAFRGATHAVPVTRGGSTRPLYVTGTGLSLSRAVEIVRDLHGGYRLPDALRRVDALARTGVVPAG